jgi:hypothetical protein
LCLREDCLQIMILLQENLGEAFFYKTCDDWYISLNFVESLDILLEIIKWTRRLPSVESLGKLCEIKAYQKVSFEEN